MVRDFFLHFGPLPSFGINWKELVSCVSCQILGAWSWPSCQPPSSVQFRDTQQRGSDMNYLLFFVWITFWDKKLRHFWQRCLFSEKDFDETLDFLRVEASDRQNALETNKEREQVLCFLLEFGGTEGPFGAVKLWQSGSSVPKDKLQCLKSHHV